MVWRLRGGHWLGTRLCGLTGRGASRRKGISGVRLWREHALVEIDGACPRFCLCLLCLDGNGGEGGGGVRGDDSRERRRGRGVLGF